MQGHAGDASQPQADGQAGDAQPDGDGDGLPLPQLADFVKAWPTSVADNQVRVANAWGALTIAQRRAALAGIKPYLDALNRLKRAHVPAGFTYLADRKWTLIGEIERKAEAGQAVEVRPWSRNWWALWHAALMPGSGRNPSLMLQRAIEGKAGAEMQSAIDALRPESLKAVPADGDAGRAYRDRMAGRRLHLPRFQPGTWIYLREADIAAASIDDGNGGL